MDKIKLKYNPETGLVEIMFGPNAEYQKNTIIRLDHSEAVELSELIRVRLTE